MQVKFKKQKWNVKGVKEKNLTPIKCFYYEIEKEKKKNQTNLNKDMAVTEQSRSVRKFLPTLCK